MLDLELSGKNAVVTGASRGIGKAVALALAGQGVNLALVATAAERAEPVAAACRELGVEARAYGLDVAAHAACQAFAKSIADDLGKVDILVNNAGITRDNLLLRMSEEEWDQVISVNLKGTYNLVKAFGRQFMKNRAGRIINLASVIGLSGNAGQANYAASKGGLVALTKSLAREFASRGILVNAIAPGLIETDMTSDLPEAAREALNGAIPLARAGSPEDVAGAVLYLAGSMGNYVTGQVLVVDGGLHT